MKKFDKQEFMSRINKAKRAYDKAMLFEQELFDYLEDCFPYVELEDIFSNAENSDNIKQAITCYLAYGEYYPLSICKELQEVANELD